MRTRTDKSDSINKYKTIDSMLAACESEHLRRVTTGRAAMESGRYSVAINWFRRALADAMDNRQDYEARQLIDELCVRAPHVVKVGAK